MVQARERRAMILSGLQQDGEAAFFKIANIETFVETAQSGEATLAKSRNRLLLLMRQPKLIDDEFGNVGNWRYLESL